MRSTRLSVLCLSLLALIVAFAVAGAVGSGFPQPHNGISPESKARTPPLIFMTASARQSE